MTRELKGIHVLAITLAAFGTIITVNLVLAVKAVGTFPGVETYTPYIDSQRFQAEREAQQRLGWQANVTLDQGRLLLALVDREGMPVTALSPSIMLRRPTHQMGDTQPVLTQIEPGIWTAQVDLARGTWNADIRAQDANGAPFRVRLPLVVR